MTLDELKQYTSQPQAASPSVAPGTRLTLSQLNGLSSPAPVPARAPESGGFFKSLLGGVATTLARPVQLAAELIMPGDNTEAIDRFSREKLGGFVAPIPRNASDVKKDVGRALQVPALGLGVVGGGALFGAAASLESGNDLFSVQTAFQTALGAGGGKILGLVGKPIVDFTGKIVGKVTPEFLQSLARQGTKAIQTFAESHSILPTETSKLINEGAQKFEALANKPFDAAGNLLKSPFTKTPEQIVAAREKELATIDNQYVQLRKANQYSADSGKASRNRIASTDVLVGATDENGVIRTIQKGGAVDQYEAQTIGEGEGVVRQNLVRLGEKVNVSQIEKEVAAAIKSSGMQGDDLVSALKRAKKEISAFRAKADPDGNVPLELVHDNKIYITNKIKQSYLAPAEVKAYQKALGRGYKKTVEKYSSFNVEEVNKELSKFYQDIGLLKRLDGKRVRGGKLGKYFSSISGNIIGGLAGSAIGGFPGATVGAAVGGEVAGRIKGSMLQRTLGGKSGFVAPENKVLQKANATGQSPRLQLPAPREGAPRSQIGSGQTINMPARTQSALDERYSKSLGSLNQTYSPTPITSNQVMPPSVAPRKLPVKSIGEKVPVSSNLAIETRKYKDDLVSALKRAKSAEEFVNSRETAYHVTPKSKSALIDKEGIKAPSGTQFRYGKEEPIPSDTFVWKDKKLAEEFAKLHPGSVIKEVDVTGLKLKKDPENFSDFVPGVEGHGYTHNGAIPAERIKTKSELTDIYNKSKSDPTNYDSAEEFVKTVDDERITFKTKDGKGSIVVTESTPKYELVDDLTASEFKKLGLEEDEFISKFEHIEVDKSMQGKGVGSNLMKRAIKEVIDNGHDFVYLNASPMGNKGMGLDALTKFYEKFGFKVIKRQGNNNLMGATKSQLTYMEES